LTKRQIDEMIRHLKNIDFKGGFSSWMGFRNEPSNETVQR